MNPSLKFCRFCALSKSPNELRDLTSSFAHFEDVKTRLILLGIDYVNFNEPYLPKSICGSCYLNLRKCYHVIERIKDSQTALRQLLLKNEGSIEKEIPNYEIQDDFPFDFDCPMLKNVDESTRETVKIMATISMQPARWDQHNATTTQQAQNAGVQQQPHNLAINVQQALTPTEKEKQEPAAKEQQPLESIAKEQQPLKPKAKKQQAQKPKKQQALKPKKQQALKPKKQQALKASQPTRMAVDKTKTKQIKDSTQYQLFDPLRLSFENGKDDMHELDIEDQNLGRQKRKHVMNLRNSAKDFLYYSPGDRRSIMK